MAVSLWKVGVSIMMIKKETGLLIPDVFYVNTGKCCDSVINLRGIVKNLREELEEANSKENYWGTIQHNQKFGIYFRGESRCHEHLLPSIGRPKTNDKGEPEIDSEENSVYMYDEAKERNMLHRFRRRAYSHYQRILTPWETIFLARHHELPTRLLDWTSNYLVALYWACEKEKDKKKDGVVWSFIRQPDETWDLNVFDTPLYEYRNAGEFKFLVEGVKIIFPFYVSPRMTAQGSLFTIQDDPRKGLEMYSPSGLSRKKFDIFQIHKWIVPNDKKGVILEELEGIGINIQTLYPDLEGLGKGIPNIEKIRGNFNAGDI